MCECAVVADLPLLDPTGAPEPRLRAGAQAPGGLTSGLHKTIAKRCSKSTRTSDLCKQASKASSEFTSERFVTLKKKEVIGEFWRG